MKVYKLRGPQFIDPQWWRNVNGQSHYAIVGDDGRIALQGEYLKIDGDSLAAGTRVVVKVDSHFTCRTQDDIEAAELKLAEEFAVRNTQRLAKLQAQQADAVAFNQSLSIPVSWDTGYKDVLSGLSETSWGNGMNRATVVHIVLLEDMQYGRMKRNAGDFLCTSASGSNGKQWSTTVARSHNGAQEYPSKVTCKKCIEIAQRMSK